MRLRLLVLLLLAMSGLGADCGGGGGNQGSATGTSSPAASIASIDGGTSSGPSESTDSGPAVPEPGAMIVFSVGLLIAGAAIRRTR
jgi:hypothetical protein